VRVGSENSAIKNYGKFSDSAPEMLEGLYGMKFTSIPEANSYNVMVGNGIFFRTKGALLKDLKHRGFLFESLVYHHSKCMRKPMMPRVSHYRDSTGLEIDAIVRQNGGAWAAFEVKLGIGMHDEAANNSPLGA